MSAAEIEISLAKKRSIIYNIHHTISFYHNNTMTKVGLTQIANIKLDGKNFSLTDITTYISL